MVTTAPKNPAMYPWFTPREAAFYLGIALGTLRNWTSQRSIPFVKRGRFVRYHRDELDQWLANSGRNTLAGTSGPVLEHQRAADAFEV